MKKTFTVKKQPLTHAKSNLGIRLNLKMVLYLEDLVNPDDGISNAIVVGGMGRERNLVLDRRITDFKPTTQIKGTLNREGIRKMTPREWARLQGFPYKNNLSVTLSGRAFRYNLLLFKEKSKRISTSIPNAKAD